MPQKTRLAMIGCGGIARAHVRGWAMLREHGNDEFDLVAACDPHGETLETFAAFAAENGGFRPKLYRDVDALIGKGGVDAADICTTHATHHVVAEACLGAGIDVMVEKPLGITVLASRRIIDAAEKHGRIVATAENIRRALGMRTARWLIRDRGILGKPLMFFVQSAGYSTFGEPISPAMRWRLRRAESGGFYAIDSGAHFLDGIRYLFGDVVRVYAKTLTLEPVKVDDGAGGSFMSDVEDTFTTVLEFENGMIGTWSFSRALPGEGFRRVLYYGSNGSIEDQADVFHGFQNDATFTFRDGSKRTLRDYEREYLLTIDAETRQRFFPYGITSTVAIECYDFLQSVRARTKPEVDGWEGLRAKAIADAMYESSATGEAVLVQDVVDGSIDTFQRPINEGVGLID